MTPVPLREIAHVRAGEKGDRVNLAVIPYRESDFDLVRSGLTQEALNRTFSAIAGAIELYEVPGIQSFNIVMEQALDGGRSRNILFDESGKALSGLAAGLLIDVPSSFVPRSAEASRGDPVPSGASHREPGGGIRLGCATGWARDRFEPASVLARTGNLDYLCFETMSEVTMSAAQVARLGDPSLPGFDPYLLERLVPVMEVCRDKQIRVVTNQGWRDPLSAAEVLARELSDAGLRGVRIAAIVGGDLTEQIGAMGLCFEDGDAIADHAADVVSAEVYLGARDIAGALDEGADVVITPRVTDASLFVGPLIHEFGWRSDALDELAMGVTVGHLLECGAQVTGGYFADPGYKDVAGLADIGYPIAQVHRDAVFITKPLDTGGLVSPATCKEQLLYEIGDPSSYLNPDVIADFSGVSFRSAGPDLVFAEGFSGREPPPTLKALVGLDEGWVCEQFVLYAGAGALQRAQLAEEILVDRLARRGIGGDRLRFDRVGVDAIHREATPYPRYEPYEVALRIALRAPTRAEAGMLRREVDPMAATGPAGTGKWSPMADMVRPIIGLRSTLVPRESIASEISFIES
ncbi:MAG: DUF1446 domain-containing protein [Acidimicrobiia bacterium]|nr:DUF1446 domain-containing protein [Acidimicrobiia bacterium]